MKAFDYAIVSNVYSCEASNRYMHMTHSAFIRPSRATNLLEIARAEKDNRFNVYLLDTKNPVNVSGDCPIDYKIYRVMALFKVVL